MAKVAKPAVEIRPTSVESAKAALGELVMAWARDIETGEPRYIGEIDADHRGGKCGCECPSCRLALIAVNAARDKVMKRPHFRHPEGAQRDECAILAARAAAMRLLAEEGVIELPRRRMSATAEGLSGAMHEAWVEAPAQRVRVASIDFRDRAYAMLTLEDGRTLRVALTGGITEQAGGDGDATLIPTITIDVDSSIAGMDQAEIRKRLQLVAGNICWRSHWNDAELMSDARAQATETAIDALDWLPDDIELPEGLSPATKRESLLHHEVKRILERAGQLTVPGLEVLEELRTAGQPTLQRRWSVGDRVLDLTNTRLEHRMRPLIPDVVCEARAQDGQAFDPLIIEVTVTNVIDDERKGQIRAQGFAALEIDLSMTGGRATRSELHRLVVHEVSVKRWLYYPDLDTVSAGLQAQMQAERDLRVEAARIAEERRRRILEAPIAQIAGRYLQAVEHMLIEQARLPAGSGQRPDFVTAKAAGAISVYEMAQRGYPEAGDEDLLGFHRILPRLLSIRNNRGVGYGFGTAVEVLNAIQQSQPGNRSDWTLYLIAAKVYLPKLPDDKRTWFEDWRDTVVAAVKRTDYMYMRSSRYDRFLSLLFPEMAPALAKPFGKRATVPEIRWDEGKKRFVRGPSEHTALPAGFLARDTVPRDPLRHGAGGDIKDWFFRGAELEAWKRANPSAAADWEATLQRFGVE
ncbi:MAG: hypothetical protein Q7U73_03050 [Rubrivivax sp.]|nr:hypothetical protein [Rubrivivax sp.]